MREEEREGGRDRRREREGVGRKGEGGRGRKGDGRKEEGTKQERGRDTVHIHVHM